MNARKAALPIVVGAALILLATNVTWLLKGDAHASWRNAVLTGFALVASIPLAMVINGIRHAATSDETGRTVGLQLKRLLDLRELLQRSLAAGGAILALITLQTGSLLAVERSVHSAFGNRPPQYVLVVGGVATITLVLAYVPGWKALQRYVERVNDVLFPLAGLNDATEVLLVVSSRQRLREMLSLENNVFADLQSGVVALAPLMAGVAAAFLPH